MSKGVSFSRDISPPRSGVPAEISFRRLLQSCEEIASGDCKGRSDLKDWSRSPSFHTSIETLQDLVADLETFSRTRVAPFKLQLYKERVESIAKSLQPIKLPAYTIKLDTTVEYSNNKRPANLTASQTSDGILGGNHASSTSELRQRSGKTSDGPLHKTTQASLDRNKNLQNALTDEMVALAAGLKKNAQAMQQAVGRREALLDETEEAIDGSLASAKRSSKESKVLKVRGSYTFCMIIMAVLVVSMAFVATYIFIKTTSFVGYKSRRRSTP